MISAGLLHQVIRGSPVAMTIEQRTDNSTAQHSRKCFLISFRIERGGYFLAAREAANVQALFIRRAATEARHVWRIGLLETLFTRHRFVLGVSASWLEIFSREDAKGQTARR